MSQKTRPLYQIEKSIDNAKTHIMILTELLEKDEDFFKELNVAQAPVSIDLYWSRSKEKYGNYLKLPLGIDDDVLKILLLKAKGRLIEHNKEKAKFMSLNGNK